MSILSKSLILATSDLSFEEVSVPEWGGSVRVGTLSAAQRERYEFRLRKATEEGGEAECVRALLVAACAVDEAGQAIFTIEDVAALAQKSCIALNRVFVVAAKLNLLTAAAIGEAAKN